MKAGLISNARTVRLKREIERVTKWREKIVTSTILHGYAQTFPKEVRIACINFLNRNSYYFINYFFGHIAFPEAVAAGA
jgi:hypothetical protein